MLGCLAGCDSTQDIIESFAGETLDIAKERINEFRTGDREELLSILTPELGEKLNTENVEKIRSYFPEAEAEAINLVTYKYTLISSEGAGQGSSEVLLQYAYQDYWLLVGTVLVPDIDGTLLIAGLHVEPLRANLRDIHAFTFSGKSILHYLVYEMFVIVPLFIIATLFFCWRTPIPRRKWLWIIFIIFGLTSISFNWTSGQYSFVPLGFVLFGSAFFRGSLYTPLILQTSIPVGAILFWIRRRKWLADAKAQSATEA